MSRRKTLRIPSDGPCAGHPCDGCDRCLAGDCCGNDVGEAGLPLEGSWPGQHFCPPGVLARSKDGKLKCACCGEHFEDLSKHVRSHNLTADAYRSMWGLNSTTALVSARLSKLKADLGHVHGHRLNRHEWNRPTPEQRSRWAAQREARAETRRKRQGQPRASTGRWVQPRPGRFVARLHPTKESAM